MKSNLKFTATAISVGLLSLSLNANAQIQWSGFATVTAGMMTNNDEEYAGYGNVDSNGDGIKDVDNKLDWLQNSKVGLQASADLQEGLNFTVQLLAYGKDDFSPEIKWLYAGYEVNDELSLKVGRLRAPLYKYSDYIDVGYTYHWVMPPVETYNLDMDTAEGIGFYYNSPIGDIDSNLSFLFGRVVDETIAMGKDLPIEINKLFVLSWDLTYENFTSRASFSAANEISVDLSSLDSITALTGSLAATGNAANIDDVLVDEDDAYFASIAIGYDNGDQFVMAEGTYQNTGDNIFGIVTSWYITSGIRYESMTYHLSVANVESDTPDFILDGISAGPVYDAFNANLQSRHGQTTSWTVGARYDFHPNADLKVQYTYVDDHDTPNAFGDGNLIMASIDIVF